MPRLTDMVLKIMFSACSSQNIGHYDLISGFQGDLPRTSLNVQLEVSGSNSHDLCPANGRRARRTAGRPSAGWAGGQWTVRQVDGGRLQIMWAESFP